MPKNPPAPSTLRQYKISDFINLFSEIIVKKYSTCAKHNCVCRVHVRSEKYSTCNQLGQQCNIKVTQLEFKRLAAKKVKLKAEIQESRNQQEAAFKEHKEALEKMRVARAKEERLQQQIDLLDRRANKAIAVEER
jgi:hypothetical protein